MKIVIFFNSSHLQRCSKMIKIRSVLFCGLFSLAIILAAKQKDYKNYYIKGFRCNASEKYVYPNYSCFAKSFSRTFSTANAYAIAKVPLFNVTVSKVDFYLNPLGSDFYDRALRHCSTNTGRFTDKFFEYPRSRCAISTPGF